MSPHPGQQTGWSPGRTIINAEPARIPEHHCEVPVRARIVWADVGEQWLDTTALGWTGDLVYVSTWGTGHGFNACWLQACDVERR